MKPGQAMLPCSKLSGEALAKIYILTILVCPLFTHYLPETALTRWPYAASFADFVAAGIPAIDKLTTLSQFPQVTRLFMALVWGIVVPIFAALCVLAEPQTNHLRKMKAPAWSVWTTPFLGALLCWSIITLPFTKAASRPDLHCGATIVARGICLISDSRIWLGILGIAVSLVVPITIVVICRWPNILREYYSNK